MPDSKPPTKAQAAARGHLIARLLAGSWRSDPPRPELTGAELDEIALNLLASGAGPLAWRQTQRSAVEARCLAELSDAYRWSALQATRHETVVASVFTALERAGIEGVVFKGWAVARLYADSALRPQADIDLAVRPRDLRAAKAVIADLPPYGLHIDLHAGFEKFGEASDEPFFQDSELVPAGPVSVRVPAPEEHLRILCVHLLGPAHALWRPLWLCDVGALLEATGELDWDRCLSGRSERADRVAVTVRLAIELLGTRPKGLPLAVSERKLPGWLAPAVWRQWGMPGSPYQREYPTMAELARSPAELVRGVRRRWPNPIEATLGLERPFTSLPRGPYQVWFFARRLRGFVTRLPRELGRR